MNTGLSQPMKSDFMTWALHWTKREQRVDGTCLNALSHQREKLYAMIRSLHRVSTSLSSSNIRVQSQHLVLYLFQRLVSKKVKKAPLSYSPRLSPNICSRRFVTTEQHQVAKMSTCLLPTHKMPYNFLKPIVNPMTLLPLSDLGGPRPAEYLGMVFFAFFASGEFTQC